MPKKQKNWIKLCSEKNLLFLFLWLFDFLNQPGLRGLILRLFVLLCLPSNEGQAHRLSGLNIAVNKSGELGF